MTNTPASISEDTTPGSVVTFYSFKGGVGRSMALANIAVLLARAGKRVLCVDWDLEAPGLDRYFRAIPSSIQESAPDVSEPTLRGGLLNILEQSTPERLAPWQNYLSIRTAPDRSEVHYIRSGEDNSEYSERLPNFNCAEFFIKNQGGVIIEALRSEWKKAYHYVLVDSRTGLSDSSGVCTIQMPDLLILLIAPNRQNIDWCERIARGIRQGRQALPFDRAFLPIIPVLARFDVKEESDRASVALDEVTRRFKPYLADWLPVAIEPRDMMAWSILPYIPRYSFDEALAVEDEPTTGPDGLTFRYQLLSALIESRFRGVRDILAGVGVPGAALAPLLPPATELRAELRRDSSAMLRHRAAILERKVTDPLAAIEALETLAGFVPPGEAESLLGDALRILADPEVGREEEIPRLMLLRGKALADIGRGKEGEILLKEAITRSVEILGQDDARIAQAHEAYARFLLQQNRRHEAAENYTLAIKTYDAAANPDVSAQLNALNALAQVWQEIGRYTKAESPSRRVLDIREKTSGSEPTKVAEACGSLAKVLRHIVCYPEAEKLWRRALTIYEEAWGPEHVEVARACGNLARVLQDIANYAEAEPLYRRALIIYENRLGTKHPDVADACGDLALLLGELGP